MSTDLPKLPPRPADGHKGTFGTVCVVGGQSAAPRVMIGGPAFAAIGALRSGAGLVVLALPEPVMNTGLEIVPSATGLSLPVDGDGALIPSEIARLLDEHEASWDCIAVGPGLGADIPQQQIVVRLVSCEDIPLVIDADALNSLASVPEFDGDFRAPAILTPHPGEYQRLAKALDLVADPIDPEQRGHAAELLARRLGCVVVLKGAGTIVSDGVKTWRNPTGGVALATAGTGDVLAGLIAGFVAQFFKRSLGIGSKQISAEQQGGLSLHDCARLGVYVHGFAADRWSAVHGSAGMLAMDLLDTLPDVLNELRDET